MVNLLGSELQVSSLKGDRSGSELQVSGSEPETPSSEPQTPRLEPQTPSSEIKSPGLELKSSSSELKLPGSEPQTLSSEIKSPGLELKHSRSKTLLWNAFWRLCLLSRGGAATPALPCRASQRGMVSTAFPLTKDAPVACLSQSKAKWGG